MIDFISKLVRQASHAIRPGLRTVRVHRIPTHPALPTLDGVETLRCDLGYLRGLCDLGRAAAAGWLEPSFEEIGGRSDA
jgi:hypothetical protein